jgi:hypothetical protein
MHQPPPDEILVWQTLLYAIYEHVYASCNENFVFETLSMIFLFV